MINGDNWETQKNMSNEARHVSKAYKQLKKDGMDVKIIDVPKNQGFSKKDIDNMNLARKQLGN